MTKKSITSDQQRQFTRLVEDASNRALKQIVPDKEGLQRLIECGGEFQAYVVAGIARFISKQQDYTLARTILGADFISPEDIMLSRKGVVYTQEQLLQFGHTVPSQEVLEWCRDNGYMLIAGPNRPMSLLEIRVLWKYYFYSNEGGWYAKQSFAESDKVETLWIMLRKEPVPQSTSKNWNEQQALLSDNEVTPNIAEVAWCMTTYKAVRNTNLLPSFYVRTSSFVSDGYHACVGSFDSKGLRVYNWNDYDDCDGDLGVSAARK